MRSHVCNSCSFLLLEVLLRVQHVHENTCTCMSYTYRQYGLENIEMLHSYKLSNLHILFHLKTIYFVKNMHSNKYIYPKKYHKGKK